MPDPLYRTDVRRDGGQFLLRKRKTLRQKTHRRGLSKAPGDFLCQFPCPPHKMLPGGDSNERRLLGLPSIHCRRGAPHAHVPRMPPPEPASFLYPLPGSPWNARRSNSRRHAGADAGRPAGDDARTTAVGNPRSNARRSAGAGRCHVPNSPQLRLKVTTPEGSVGALLSFSISAKRPGRRKQTVMRTFPLPPKVNIIYTYGGVTYSVH